MECNLSYQRKNLPEYNSSLDVIRKQTLLDSNPKIAEAINYAMTMHHGQARKDGSPFINHPLRVGNYISCFKDSSHLEELMIAGYLHDTLEDTSATYYDLVNRFGYIVAGLVREVTNEREIKNLIGKTTYLQIKMTNMTDWALVIKLCDRLDNTIDLVNADSEFRMKKVKETSEILRYLLENRKLSQTQMHIVIQIIKQLSLLKTMYPEEQHDSRKMFQLKK